MNMMCGYSDDGAGRVIVEEDNESNDDGVHGSGSNSHDGQKILESENLDRRETTIEDLRVVLTIFSIARQYKFDSDDDDDDVVTFSGGNIVHVWDGWDAALIVSKSGNVKQGVTLDSYNEKVQEEDGSREMTVNECKKQHLGKRKVRGTSKARGRDSCGKKHLQIGLWSAAIGNRKCRGEVEKIVEAVVALTLKGMLLLPWDTLAKLHNTVRDSVFGTFAKFVLSIFDVDDFKRIYNVRKIKKKCAALYSSYQSHLESDGGPLKAFTEGGMDVKAFSILREHDVGEMQQRYERYLSIFKDYGYQYDDFKVFLWDLDISKAELDIVSSPRDRGLALGEMQKYVPLKEDCKVQLTLELRRARGYHVLDTLFVEAWKCVKFEELVNLENSKLSEFVHTFKCGLFFLAELKISAEAVTFPLSCGVFGRFADEVIEVVQIADHERRMRDHRFINLKHILFGLSLSRVGETVRRILNDRPLNCLALKPVKVPIYIIYKLSGDVASVYGDEMVRLEHLAFVIVSAKLENNCPNEWTYVASDDNNKRDAELLGILRKANGKCPVNSWKDDRLKCLPEECFERERVTCNSVSEVKALIHAFGTGLRLPEIR
ncbi:uncharacterized protein LOC114282377 isoform X2 [Camellia sinensis]|uniref:uncharacterized protein LOC114282377 isoform X2 n=1 Tax=Camellia sinensis TaxID=4442 RepID=UPI0010367E28|nr:uncharacterized protein LOC114282377 isoform X2 [Camellia sinensis]